MTDQNTQTEKLESHDVLQLSRDDGKTWQDFSTLRSEEEFKLARRYVEDPGAWARQDGANAWLYKFRVTRPLEGNRVVIPLLVMNWEPGIDVDSQQFADKPVHVEVHVNGYAVELCGAEVSIFELGTRRKLEGVYFFEGGRIRAVDAPKLDNEHGTNWQNYLAIEEQLRFAVEHSGVE